MPTPSPPNIDLLAEMFAPVVVLHPRERFAPVSADEFLAGSQLVWNVAEGEAMAFARGLRSAANGPPLEVHWLGVEGLRNRAACPYRHKGWVPGDFTRPFESGRGVQGRDDLEAPEGFLLRPGEDEICGDVRGAQDRLAALNQAVVRAPMYWEVVPASEEATWLVCFWFFFGASTRPKIAIGPAAMDFVIEPGATPPADEARRSTTDTLAGPAVSRSPRGAFGGVGAQPATDGSSALAAHPIESLHLGEWLKAGLGDVVHDGDWEGITVRVVRSNSGWAPEALVYRRHGQSVEPISAADAVWYSPADGSTAASWGGHRRPVVYCADGSHASYPSDREGWEVDARVALEDGVLWVPSATRLIDVQRTPWYGFGGSWGRAVTAEFNGPLGPSEYKQAKELWPSTPPNGHRRSMLGGERPDIR